MSIAKPIMKTVLSIIPSWNGMSFPGDVTAPPEIPSWRSASPQTYLLAAYSALKDGLFTLALRSLDMAEAQNPPSVCSPIKLAGNRNRALLARIKAARLALRHGDAERSTKFIRAALSLGNFPKHKELLS